MDLDDFLPASPYHNVDSPAEILSAIAFMSQLSHGASADELRARIAELDGPTVYDQLVAEVGDPLAPVT